MWAGGFLQQQGHRHLPRACPCCPARCTDKVAARPADNWDAAGATVTSEQMAAFVEHVKLSGMSLADCPGSSNDCLLYGVLHQVGKGLAGLRRVPWRDASVGSLSCLCAAGRQHLLDCPSHGKGFQRVGLMGGSET